MSEPAPAPEPGYSLEDAMMLARLLYAECRGEPRQGQLAVAQCVLDRQADGRWGDTVAEVIMSKRQFAEPGELTDELMEVAVEALMGKRAIPEHNVLYFRRTTSPKKWHADYLGHIAKHAFYGFPKEP